MMTTSEVEYELGHPCKQLDQIERRGLPPIPDPISSPGTGFLLSPRKQSAVPRIGPEQSRAQNAAKWTFDGEVRSGRIKGARGKGTIKVSHD